MPFGIGGKTLAGLLEYQMLTDTGDDILQRTPVGTAGGPGLHDVASVDVAMKQRERDLGGRETLPDVAHQEIDHRGAAEGAGQLVAEGGHTAEQREVVGAGGRG